MDLVAQWREALAGVAIRHINLVSRVSFEISDDGVLCLMCDRMPDTRNPGVMIAPFVVSNVRLRFFPGVRLARAWLAAAWAGYVMHEALEMVTADDTRPLDPHEGDYVTNPYNRSLRVGLPVELTPETMLRAFEVVMSPEAARELAKEIL